MVVHVQSELIGDVKHEAELPCVRDVESADPMRWSYIQFLQYTINIKR